MSESVSVQEYANLHHRLINCCMERWKRLVLYSPHTLAFGAEIHVINDARKVAGSRLERPPYVSKPIRPEHISF